MMKIKKIIYIGTVMILMFIISCSNELDTSVEIGSVESPLNISRRSLLDDENCKIIITNSLYIITNKNASLFEDRTSVIKCNEFFERRKRYPMFDPFHNFTITNGSCEECK